MQKISYDFKAHCLSLSYHNKPLFMVLRKIHYIFCFCYGPEFNKVKKIYSDISQEINDIFTPDTI